MSVEAIGPSRPQRRMPIVVVAGAGAAALAAAGVTALAPGSPARMKPTPTVASAPSAAGTATASTLDREISRLQQRLRTTPADDASWATLGFDYVQQAKVTVDPTYYPKAQAALARSLRIDRRDNYLAMAGEATLASARHDFRAALGWARGGLAIDDHNALLYGALTDALTQLGYYRAAERAVTTMELVSPGTPAETRLSYAAQLRGDDAAAAAFMRRALSDAGSGADVAFARYYLGELALGHGDGRAALRQFAAGLAVAPGDTMLLEGRAKAEAAVGRAAAAVRDFRQVVARVPQPTYVLEYGELLQALGRDRAAAQQWSLFRAEQRLFLANGVTLDVDAILFEADHGSPRAATAIGAAALTTRPSLDTYDAYGWALHRAGRDGAALVAADQALRTGVRNALFLFHRGEIERSLGRLADARTDLAAALRLNPSFSPLWASQARADLSTLRRAA
jgi:tetratricopeptide (TPR) repeat protein